MAVVDPSNALLGSFVPAPTSALPDAGGVVAPVVNEEPDDGELHEESDGEDITDDDGFGDDAEGNPDTGFQDDLDDDDDLDEFDDIDEDDFDDNFDDDFEEEDEDDYEIEIDDEISTEFGLGSKANQEPEIVDGLEDFEDFDNVE